MTDSSLTLPIIAVGLKQNELFFISFKWDYSENYATVLLI